ncbi:MAG: RdgB/HAM1 family non-canonical purine NTP pyrophosphatase [Candidatus Omnitrophota bacterium]|nr:RdgB/HAM1 family non-canonical purine NTP pyrophosphatase [Candidatus Omnitrophota bacterium]
MRQELLVATKNIKKFQEIKEILKGLNLKITSLRDYPGSPRIVENGSTFKANAIKKAVCLARLSGKLTLGEDSGLCVKALGGRPGVRSSRYSGKNKSDSQNNIKLLKELSGYPVKKRKGYYQCAVAIADKFGLIQTVEGKCCGSIGLKARGNHGFGYDPLFVIPKFKKTFAELGPYIKHSMSHRYRALKKIKGPIIKYFKKVKKPLF